MYFSRATLLSALAGLALAQSASESELALSTAVTVPVSTGAPSAENAGGAGMVPTHIVSVGGPNGSLAFYPDNVVAQPGDMVQFQFYPKNHSVVQSTFDNPCVPIQNIMPNKTDAFYSGFMPTNASFGATNQILTYTVRVPDDKPIWFYCSQGMHCQAGMVGAINAPTEGNKTMSAFTALAAQASENLSPGQSGGSSSAGNTPTSPSAGGGAAAGGGSGTSGAPGSATGAADGAAEEATGAASRRVVGLGAAVAAVFVALL